MNQGFSILYVLFSDKLNHMDRLDHGFPALKHEVSFWLWENVGPQAIDFARFKQDLEKDIYHWCYIPNEVDRSDIRHRPCQAFAFRRESDAVKFKEVWDGIWIKNFGSQSHD